MQQSHASDSNSRSTIQQIYLILFIKAHKSVSGKQTPVRILGQMNPIDILILYLHWCIW